MAGVTAKQVYDYVKEQIISKELFPGNRVAEEDVAEAMHTSRTTVRSALTRLHYDGLVDVIPNCGAFVAKPTMVDMYRVYAVRRVLEAEAARLAATRITEEALDRMEDNLKRQKALASRFSMAEYVDLNRQFHWEIVRAADNEYIEKYLHELFNKTAIFLIFYDQTGTNRESLQTHEALLAALRARDEEAAVVAAQADIHCALENSSMV